MRIFIKICGWLIFIVFGIFLILFIPLFFVFIVRLLYGYYNGCFKFELNDDFKRAASLISNRVCGDLFRDFSRNMSTWFSALGTIGAVIVALFQESIKNRLYRPILRFSITGVRLLKILITVSCLKIKTYSDILPLPI